MKVVFFGTPEFVIPVLEALNDHFELLAVVTAPPRPVGRKQTLTDSAVSLKAKELGIKVLAPEKLDKDLLNSLSLLRADFFVVAAYGKIIPLEFINLPNLASINIHPSLLPKYRGASPVQSAILNGEKVTGVTFIRMDEEMDHGAILLRHEYEVKKDDNFDNLVKQLFKESANLLPDLILRYQKGQVKEQKQDDSQASYCKVIQKKDGFFEIDNPPSKEELDRMIRAYFPWPNAWTLWKGKVVKFYPDGKIQMEGKSIVSFEEFKRGYPEIYPFLSKIYPF